MADKSFPFDCILFDLDDTLYSGDLDISRYMRRNIEDYLMGKLGISKERASELRSELFRSHGSTFIGLRAQGYDVHPDEYHGYVHGRLPYEIIQPDPHLHDLLTSIPHTKILFTNSDRCHMRRALERLGIDEGMFAKVICFETLNSHLFASSPHPRGKDDVVLKPSRTAMEIAISVAGTDPRRTLFLDDSERNIVGGKALGLRTVLVGKKGKIKEADYVLDSIRNLRSAVPEIWKTGEDQNKGGLIAPEHVLLRHHEMATTFVEA